ncbi:MAG: class I SAM-dependent methyltransferase [Bacteroidia bacterium]|jgi:2-polyprenyl-3-methyl-5-hydroxy-6-metoxy-1,4-benzoquinol methylase|nr:class I SAM-dependent methyltransferase [Bacteroidia bacterium]
MKRLEIDYSLGSMDALVSMARYSFVNRTLNDKNLRVLDYGCGSGYGTRILKEKFTQVVSHDVYPDGYAPEGIEVEQDITKLAEGSFDVITCFEVIEHMDEAAQHELMNTMRRLLKPDGTLFISTVRKMDPPPTQNRRDYHIRELSYAELYQFCADRFRNVYTFGQIDQIISTFYPENHYHFVFICTGTR